MLESILAFAICAVLFVAGGICSLTYGEINCEIGLAIQWLSVIGFGCYLLNCLALLFKILAVIAVYEVAKAIVRYWRSSEETEAARWVQ